MSAWLRVWMPIIGYAAGVGFVLLSPVILGAILTWLDFSMILPSVLMCIVFYVLVVEEARRKG